MTSKKVNVEFCSPEFSATKIVMRTCHVDDSAKGRYNMILGRNLLTTLGLDIKFSDRVIVGVERLYEGCSVSMVDVSNY